MEAPKIGWAITSFADHATLVQDADLVANLIVLAWEEIGRVMQSIVGKNGVNALFHRSIEITSTAYPWLAAASKDPQSAINLDALRATLLEQETSHFAAASDTLLQHFYHLLTNLIGFSLTERLLRPALNPLLNGAATKDVSP